MIAEFVTLLQEVNVGLLVDVRSIPRSWTNPQFNSDVLPESLATVGIAYRHLSALGGLRHRHRDAVPTLNTLWQNKAFRNYADYAATGAFRAGFDELRTLAHDHRCAIMCAEAVWWRCHRRIITDYLLADGIPVAHIMGHNKVSPAKLTPGVLPQPDGTLVYPAVEDEGAKRHANRTSPSAWRPRNQQFRQRHLLCEDAPIMKASKTTRPQDPLETSLSGADGGGLGLVLVIVLILVVLGKLWTD
jgi:Protein of unknown function, DUF488